ncbi:MAG: hypothetical protein COU06_01800 [Candidatus Harrisonbacteria bacterium CG10_big_fil_rev_8_21_14_0_10_38_8]|uniref:Uncharacterized protein n=1 Tax=Candidatus Harrisonbacteria bacterium CG10_big_fil_rev_8_21_14_0_10_38_8 TaxID=1974582 RepID=A0A2M6WJZ4_9BACT|nr:MAG: hypothetical protein COU06_01800 [Candidatus Harrisonbacteria bacterium CG10_big_fil_rev_8_21_14_0_10_38_8]
MSLNLEQTETKDGLTLNGVVSYPKRNKGEVLIFVHGLMGKFYSGKERLEELARALNKEGIALASFNNRGHDIVASYKKFDKKYVLLGGGFEKFTDCVKDIESYINFFSKKGYKKIYFLGHSTGANKLVYTFSDKKRYPRVKGVVLLSGLSDAVADGKEESEEKLRRIKSAKLPKDALLYPKYWVVPATTQRVLSLLTPMGVEDVFQSHQKNARFRLIKKLNLPTLVMIGDMDKYLDIPAKEYTEMLTKHLKKGEARIIKGADHAYTGREKQMARAITSWIKTL